MQRHIFKAAAMASLLSLTSCGSFLGDDLVKEGRPVGTLIIKNESGVGIDVVTVSKCSAMSHGLNRLSGVIPDGGSVTWAINTGCWDIMAGRTGTCSQTGCNWLQASQRANIAPYGTTRITFGATQ